MLLILSPLGFWFRNNLPISNNRWFGVTLLNHILDIIISGLKELYHHLLPISIVRTIKQRSITLEISYD